MDKNEPPTSGADATSAAKAKKPYSSPTLDVYGDIAAVTQAVGKAGKRDGGGGVAKGTQP